MSSVATLSSITFLDNEVNLCKIDRLTRYSPRGKRLSQVVTAHCFGEIQAATSDLIIARINTIENALANDNQEFRYTIGGTIAHSLLNNADCISGVKIIHRSFPKGDGAELATKRSFSFSLQGTYDAQETDLVSWTESIRTIGNGGPKFFVLDTVTVPFAIYTSLASAVYYQQTGAAVGYKAYPDAPSPIQTGIGFFNDRVTMEKVSGRNMGSQLRFFTTKWSYYMGRDTTTFGGLDATPTSK